MQGNQDKETSADEVQSTRECTKKKQLRHGCLCCVRFTVQTNETSEDDKEQKDYATEVKKVKEKDGKGRNKQKIPGMGFMVDRVVLGDFFF